MLNGSGSYMYSFITDISSFFGLNPVRKMKAHLNSGLVRYYLCCLSYLWNTEGKEKEFEIEFI